MKVTKRVGIDIALDGGVVLQLDKINAFAMYLWVSGVAWSHEGIMSFHGRTVEPFTLSDPTSAWGPLQTNRFQVIHEAGRSDEVIFTLGPQIDQFITVDRVELYLALKNFVLTEISALLEIPEQLQPFASCNDEGIAINQSWPTGHEHEGVSIDVTIHQGHLSFTRNLPHAPRSEVASYNLFFSNQNLPRPAHIKYLGMPMALYTGGYRGKETEAQVLVWLGDNKPVLMEM